jgi:3-hydroxybutyryl-CoA dehydrogenase
MSIKLVGVIGAGVMGVGVAQNLAETSHQVILLDVSQEILERAKNEIQKSVRINRMFKKSEKLENPDLVVKRIEFSTDYTLLENADFIVENATENWEIKREIYLRIDKICPENCVFAANTSAIPITRIASVTGRTPQVLGIHFMNPVPMKSTVEMIRGYHTSDQTIETARSLLKQMGKRGILVNDSPGFVTNRVLMLTINEAIYLIQDRVASAEDVDAIFKDCFGHKMGPLETADLIGLDTILYSIEVLYDSFNDSKYRPCPLLKKMVDAGLHGRKSGQGFYNYQ